MNGFACSELEVDEPRKSIVRSKSFAQKINTIESLQAAISHHVASGAAKLRQQNSRAHVLTVAIKTNPFSQDKQYKGVKSVSLPLGSNDTLELNHLAQKLLTDVYRQGFHYKKCGIELSGIESISNQQFNLFDTPKISDNPALMATIDDINKTFGKGAIKLGTEYLSNDWQMRRQLISSRFTTRWEELLVV
ncbi:hypothetical protein B0181_11245 [Moraxella caviae]|uniref:DNA polymerase V subunit UmuC n=2 Tax=Moraxella caviae TaxID=34060 RepID=A0A1S9ZU71_9GAMM|nr:hypothetical protein B0181_11245 [Moraxella caviae]STZ13563.1 DNA polymerase V subunit UmuC [Moraxella caviae]